MADRKKNLDYGDTLHDPRKPTVSDDAPPEASIEPKKGPGRPRKKSYRPDQIEPVGIGIPHEDAEWLKEIAEARGVTRHELLLWILNDWIKKYKEGKVDIPIRKVTVNKIG